MRFIALFAVCLFVLLAMTQAKPCICPRLYDPVCGSDGVTYTSVCNMECSAKKKGIAIKVVKTGECKKGT